MVVAPGDAAAPALDFLSAYAAAATRVVSTIPTCDMGGRVPACPGWSTYDLVVHLGNVHAWAASIVETGRRAAEQNDRPPSRRPKTVARWYAGKAEDLLQVLRTARAADPCWTLSSDHGNKGFWSRRQTHETLVHLSDLLQACGRTTDVAAPLASDGVAEVLEVFLPRMHARGRRAALSEPVLLHATDTGDMWEVAPSLGPDGPPAVTRTTASSGTGAGDDVVSAPAADLLLLLWKRVSPYAPAVTLDGDRRRLLAFLGSPLTP